MSYSGFTRVLTNPAGAGSISVPELGVFAPHVNPAVGPDGTVFLGTAYGRVVALRPEGEPYWNRELPNGDRILLTPTVTSDGTVWVIGCFKATDHRGGGAPREIVRWTIHRFINGGGYPGPREFPLRFEATPWLVGAPTVWRWNDAEVVLISALYRRVAGHDLALLAYSLNGDLLDQWYHYIPAGEVTSSGFWESLLDALMSLPIGSEFTPGTLPSPPLPPFPGPDVAPRVGGGTPVITLVNRAEKKLMTFRFDAGPGGASGSLVELFHTGHAPDVLWSNATLLPDAYTLVGTDKGLIFGPPNAGAAARPRIDHFNQVFATPSLAADGRAIAVDRYATVLGVQGTSVVSQVQLNGLTAARPAASLSYVYVATEDGLHTLDATATTVVRTFPWLGGAAWAPVIGPRGHVYAMASNVLFIFRPPRQLPDLGDVAIELERERVG
jgi:hypothetical protein